jgi:hypothetical protein
LGGFAKNQAANIHPREGWRPKRVSVGAGLLKNRCDNYPVWPEGAAGATQVPRPHLHKYVSTCTIQQMCIEGPPAGGAANFASHTRHHKMKFGADPIF